jgi:hypothetical protein
MLGRVVGQVEADVVACVHHTIVAAAVSTIDVAAITYITAITAIM